MASQQFDKTLLRQEVEELTQLLRSEEILSDLRTLVRGAGHDPQRLILAGFVENAEGLECGVLVTPEGDAYFFERNVLQPIAFSRWERVEDVSPLLDSFPALEVALKARVD